MIKLIGIWGFIVCLLVLVFGSLVIRAYHWWYVPELTEMQIWWVMAKWEWPALIGLFVFGWMGGVGGGGQHG